MGLQEGGDGAWNKGVLKEEAAERFCTRPHTGHCGEKTGGGGEGDVSLGDKTECKPAYRRKKEGLPHTPRRRGGVQIKSASGWLPWDTGERDNTNTEVYGDGGEEKNEAGSPLNVNQG